MSHESTASDAGLRVVLSVCACLVLWTGCDSGSRPESTDGLSAKFSKLSEGTRVVFGSCLDQRRPSPILAVMAEAAPDVFVMLGDNVYADTRDPEELRRVYATARENRGLVRLQRRVSTWLATWDDHDYGENDAGREFPIKAQAQSAFLDFLEVPSDSPRRERAGVYHAEIIGTAPRRVQFIMLDTRYHRSSLQPADARLAGKGPYTPDPSPEATMLGDEQWAWLAEQLRQPAEVRVIASSVQFVSQGHGWECWGNLPRERARLVGLVRETGAKGVVMISGDRHHGELSRLAPGEGGLGYPLYDLTSSSLNRGRGRVEEPNPSRLGAAHGEPNFGVIDIEWAAPAVTVRLELRGESGSVMERLELSLMDLTPE